MLQEDSEGKKYLISCGSSRLTQAQGGYSTMELELSAAIFAVKKCRFWLKGCPRTILRTDHRPLVGMAKKPLSEFDNERLLRMFESISTYNIDWEYIKGRYNTVADTLSCLRAEPGRGEELVEEFDIPNVYQQGLHLRSRGGVP